MATETAADMIEGVAEEMMAAEPEVVAGANVQIEFPHKDNVRLSNFIRFYHPDGTHSEIAAPTFNPQRPTPYRRRFLQYWLGKRGPNGGRWFFLTQQAPAPDKPFRCFVEPAGKQCTKQMKTLPDVYMHVMRAHGEESKMYAAVLEGMNQRMQAQISPETLAALGIGGPVGAPKAETPEVFYCRNDGCPRFFDREPSRNQHEYTCPQKQKGGE